MEPPPGIKDEPREQAPGLPANRSEESKAGLLDSAGRFLGFLMFAGPAMLILAAMILLPAYKGMVMHAYSNDCAAKAVEEKKLYLDCRSHVIHDIPQSELFTERLLISQTPMRPANRTVVVDKTLPPWSPMMIDPIKLPPPPSPYTQKVFYVLGFRLAPLEMADKLENPTTKLGLLLVMIGAGLAAVFLYGPPPPRKSVEDISPTNKPPTRTNQGFTPRIINR